MFSVSLRFVATRFVSSQTSEQANKKRKARTTISCITLLYFISLSLFYLLHFIIIVVQFIVTKQRLDDIRHSNQHPTFRLLSFVAFVASSFKSSPTLTLLISTCASLRNSSQPSFALLEQLILLKTITHLLLRDVSWCCCCLLRLLVEKDPK